MARLSRYTSRLFGSTPGPQEVEQFGSFANGGPNYTTDITTLQALTSWLEGWKGAIVGFNNPLLEDMNAFCIVISYFICYIMQVGIPEYDSGTTYYQNQIAASDGHLYVSRTDTNLGNSLLNSTYWFLINSDYVILTSSTTLSVSKDLIFSDSTSASRTLTLPPYTTVPAGKRYVIKDIGSGGNTTTVKATTGETIDGINTYGTALNQYDSMTVFSLGNGSWYVI